VKFSEELLLPMRREQGGKKKPWEAGCPIDVGDRSRLDYWWIKATWPDGFTATLTKTYGDLRAQLPVNNRSMDVLGSKLILEGTHKATKNAVKLDQRVGRKLLIVIYEQNRQILQCNVEEFGPCANGNQRLPETDETLIKAFDFMKPIYDLYIKDEVAKDELVNLKIKMLEERKKLPKENKKESKEGDSTGSNKGTIKKRPAVAEPKRASKGKSKGKQTKPKKKNDENDDAEPTEETDDDKESEVIADRPRSPKKACEFRGLRMPPIMSSLKMFDDHLSDDESDSTKWVE